nr:putative ribonuclease H-like domain-containing protein [Tanacetum cinerariifolium]
METQKPLIKDEDGEEVDVHMYRSMIGLLMYLTSSRPDIMFVVCACDKYQVNPKVSHLYAMKMIFRHLKGQLKLGLWYSKDSLFGLVAYTDSDYARASLDRKSTTGGCQFLGCILISWKHKRKDTQVPQPSDPTDNVANEAIHKELGDSLVRAATTTSSLEAEQDSGEDVSKQGRRIDAIDADEEITLVNIQYDAKMFDMNALDGEEVFVARQNANVVKEVVDAAQVKRVVIQEPGESTTTIPKQQPQDKGKGIMIEEPVKPKKKDQIRLDEEATKKLQVEFDKEERLAREKAEKEHEANIALIET